MTPESTDSEMSWQRHAPAYSHFGVSDTSELKWLLSIYGAAERSPFDACLSVLENVRTVIVEHEYYDPDYRSDFSHFHSRSFEQLPQHTDRLHFFSEIITTEEVRRLSTQQITSYLGYIVVRPGSARATVGRAMLAPPPTDVGEGTTIASLVRVAAKERVVLFGQALEAVGVPFMQQDSRSLRCAHVAAWICHYTCALRGFVPRQLTSQLHGSGAQTSGTIRPFPSEGLNESQLAHLLSSVGLPAHRHEIRHIQARWNKRLDDQPSHNVWHRNSEAARDVVENVRTYCARYLNSGLPILATIAARPSERPTHIVTVIGQGRVGDKKTAFIYHDDEVGPYQVAWDPIAREDKRGWVALFVPLPEKVWMLGEHAEGAAEQYIHALASSGQIDTPEMKAFRDRMDKFELGLRTYVMPASDFKQSLRVRCLGPSGGSAAETIASARMSRFVWIVEILDRKRRDAGEEQHVLGEVVIDATAADAREAVVVEHFGGYLRTNETVFVPFSERYPVYQRALEHVMGASESVREDEVKSMLQRIEAEYNKRYLEVRRQAIDTVLCSAGPYRSGRRSLQAAHLDVAAAPSNGASTG